MIPRLWLLVGSDQGTDRPTMSLIELSWTAKNPGFLETFQIIKKPSRLLGSFLDHPDIFRLSGNFPCYPETFQVIRKSSRLSRNFSGRPDTFKTIRKPSRLGRCAENQNGNLRWHLPWRGGGSRGSLECHIPILKNDFFKNRLESFPDCENVFCT